MDFYSSLNTKILIVKNDKACCVKFVTWTLTFIFHSFSRYLQHVTLRAIYKISVKLRNSKLFYTKVNVII